MQSLAERWRWGAGARAHAMPSCLVAPGSSSSYPCRGGARSAGEGVARSAGVSGLSTSFHVCLSACASDQDDPCVILLRK
jgi:hypothetical protein